MIVYHGSNVIVNIPDIRHSYRPLDFGKGFYVTTVREQAERWARRKADIYGSDKGIVNIYQMKEDFISAFQVLREVIKSRKAGYKSEK